MEIRLVYITTSSKDEARFIGRQLVEQRLAACVNILDGMESIYRWQGTLETSHEAVLIAKTTADSVDRLITEVKGLHSYDVPCAISIPVLAGNDDYLTWLRDNVG